MQEYHCTGLASVDKKYLEDYTLRNQARNMKRILLDHRGRFRISLPVEQLTDAAAAELWSCLACLQTQSNDVRADKESPGDLL